MKGTFIHCKLCPSVAYTGTLSHKENLRIPAFFLNLLVQATAKGNFPIRATKLKAIVNTITLAGEKETS